MKLKTLVIATTAALYGVAIGAATITTSPQTLKAVPANALTSSQDAALINGEGNSINVFNSPVQYPGGLNVHVNRDISKKFKPEPHLSGSDTYVVVLRDQPVALYNGSIDGMPATNTKTIQNEQSAESGLNKWWNDSKRALGVDTIESRQANYNDYLQQKHHELVGIASQKGVNVVIREQFTRALNGFSVTLTQADAAELAKLPQVSFVQRLKTLELNTDAGPQHIKADQVWAGNTVTATSHKGEGMVIGVLDTGINSDHPSFQDVGSDGYDHTNPLGAGVYLGDCANGFAAMCNDKLIGVYSWPVITGGHGAVPKNGEDYQGHGSHTAGTAGGNVVTNVPYLGAEPGTGVRNGIAAPYTFSQVSGVAPHANIIAYQVCYQGDGVVAPRGCPGEALLAGIEQATSDSVDVINFSIGGGEDLPWTDAYELAFLAAREAGVSVAASAGNAGTSSGSDEVMSSTDHTSPWLLSVAAATHDRTMSVSTRTITLSGGATTPAKPSLIGSVTTTTPVRGISDGITNGVLVTAASRDGLLDTDPNKGLCLTAFAPGTFATTEVAICKRGTNARIDKAKNVAAGGAGGFVLYNASSTDDINDSTANSHDVYPIPGFLTRSAQGTSLVNWVNASTAGTALVTIPASSITRTQVAANANKLANFSSRGPSSTYVGHLVPGITGPGVGIYAAYADEAPFISSPSGQDWAFLQGTSMSSPHIAGAMTLVRQAHPDWTPAEVQSALQMTADEVVTYGSANNPASLYRAGHGMVNVQDAINAGLVMDETGENYRLADPSNGGDVRQLNMPEIVDLACHHTCTFVRTVKATRDGSWKVTPDSGEYSVQLSVTPSEFSLKAGESIALVITGHIVDSQTQSGNSELEVWAKLLFDNTDGSLPQAHWPVALKLDAGVLPESVNFTAHRDRGLFTVKNITLPKISAPVAHSYGLTEADVERISLPQDSDSKTPFDDGVVSAADYVKWVDVPAGSARLVAEAIKKVSTTADSKITNSQPGTEIIIVGFDANGNGQADWADESICKSAHVSYLDYCNINNPAAGRYFVVLHNYRKVPLNFTGPMPIDTWDLATAVVGNNSEHEMTVELPANSDGVTPHNLSIRYDINHVEKEKVLYGAFAIGNSAQADSVGVVPVKVTRGNDDVTMNASQTRARTGQVVDVVMHVNENDSNLDRAFALSTQLPNGLTLVPGSVKSNYAERQNLIRENGNGFTMTGTQVDSSKWPRTYKQTTNATDAACMVPNFGQGNGYVDLRAFGITPSLGGTPINSANKPISTAFDLASIYGSADSQYALYNNRNWLASSVLNISNAGKINPAPYFEQLREVNFQLSTGNNTAPWATIAPLWKGSFVPGASDIHWLRTDAPIANVVGFEKGITLAYTSTGFVIVEYDDAYTENVVFPVTTPTTYASRGDKYDFEVILNKDTRFGDNQHELVYAYNNLNFNGETRGSVGVRGFEGPIYAFGAIEGHKGVDFAYNDVNTKLSNGLIICYDYVGPESTQFDVSFQVRVDEDAANKLLPIEVNTEIVGVDTHALVHNIQVTGNLTIASMSNQTTEEEVTVEGIRVAYADADSTPNTITVSGESVTAVIDAHTPGSTFDLIPDDDFSGSTVVTVRVQDNVNASDWDETTFTLTVNNENDAPVAMVSESEITAHSKSLTLNATPSVDADGDALTYSWTQTDGAVAKQSNANSSSLNVSDLAVGDYAFEVTVSDGQASDTTEVVVHVVNTLPTIVVQQGNMKTKATTVELNAAGSTDADADALQFNWTQSAGAAVTLTSGNSAVASVAGLTEGEYKFVLTVNDGWGDSIADVTVTKEKADVIVTSSPRDSGGSLPLLALIVSIMALRLRRKS